MARTTRTDTIFPVIGKKFPVMDDLFPCSGIQPDGHIVSQFWPYLHFRAHLRPRISRFSLYFSLLSGFGTAETGSHASACTTIQSGRTGYRPHFRDNARIGWGDSVNLVPYPFLPRRFAYLSARTGPLSPPAVNRFPKSVRANFRDRSFDPAERPAQWSRSDQLRRGRQNRSCFFVLPPKVGLHSSDSAGFRVSRDQHSLDSRLR